MLSTKRLVLPPLFIDYHLCFKLTALARSLQNSGSSVFNWPWILEVGTALIRSNQLSGLAKKALFNSKCIFNLTITVGIWNTQALWWTDLACLKLVFQLSVIALCRWSVKRQTFLFPTPLGIRASGGWRWRHKAQEDLGIAHDLVWLL